jgi:zinc finger protein
LIHLPTHGCRLILNFQSDTAGLSIPEIDLVLTHGTLGGRFTTLEGILDQVYTELAEKVFMRGDSSKAEDKEAFQTFLEKLRRVRCFV